MKGRAHRIFQMRRLFFELILFLTVLALVACGGGNSSTPASTGVFMDSPVSGLDYSGTSFTSGTTNALGQFNYTSGETMTFSIGSLVLGSATGAAALTPLSIISGATAASDQRVNNMLVFLQTLDADGNLNNGIQITPAIRAIVSTNASSINFNQTTTAFASSLSTLMTALNTASVFTDTYRGARTVKSATYALAHFTRSISTRPAVVSTTYGQLRGFQADANTWQWIGIPYGKPPVGDLRWRAPQNPDAWTGVREATEWGDQAAQPLSYTTSNPGGVSEDCLYLNVMAPKGASNLPVMVWFHGGAFGIMTGNAASYNTAPAMTGKSVVLVTVNHRLGPFGYMAHPLLTAEQGGHSGNYGQMDLIKALEWVRDNIAAFGGNPSNVTIFGQSGGGGKAIALMASPMATGLFHKVISESGMAATSNTVMNPSTLAVGEAKGTSLFSRLSVTTLAQARALPWSSISNRDLADFGVSAWLVYTPVVDGYFLTDTMADLINAPMASDVPFLAGANSADLIAGADLANGITAQMPSRADNNSSKQFVYHWSHVPSGWSALGVGAYHGLELVYVFGYPNGLIAHHLTRMPATNYSALTGLTDAAIGADPTSASYYTQIFLSTGYGAADAVLGNTIMTMWTNFAKTGDPSTTTFTWPEYTTAGDAYVEIGLGGAISSQTGVAATFGTAP